ncbi:MAG TPA: hypothetical protein VM933_06955 [Acidimicrobiales bacterium]|nr:hypothetical protein [Acidimicrobiales bacterium]
MGIAAKRILVGAASVVGGVALLAAPAAAHQCTNASKNAHAPEAGAQLVFGNGDAPISAKTGVLKRIEKGIIDFESGEGFHGQIGVDVDGDGAADFTTFIVGPEGEIPLAAQQNGPDDRGIVNLCGDVCG